MSLLCLPLGTDVFAYYGGYCEIYAYCQLTSRRVDVYELAHTDSSGSHYFRHVYSVGNPSTQPINIMYTEKHWRNLELIEPAAHILETTPEVAEVAMPTTDIEVVEASRASESPASRASESATDTNTH